MLPVTCELMVRTAMTGRFPSWQSYSSGVQQPRL